MMESALSLQLPRTHRPLCLQGSSELWREVNVLSCVRHQHIVLLLGACPDDGCLVYELMEV